MSPVGPLAACLPQAQSKDPLRATANDPIAESPLYDEQFVCCEEQNAKRIGKFRAISARVSLQKPWMGNMYSG